MNVEKKKQLIERIKTLEGLTGEERNNLLDLLRTSYGLVWEDRPEEVEEHLREAMPVLIEDKGKALTDGGPDAPNHVLIEGDNLEALTTLAYTHAGKIDVIYIDPPYNTGNKDFIYNDSFVDSEDSYRHSKWLSFMSKRLRIAKKLLSDHGVIFISIDDNEIAQLKLLCSDVFGYRSFLQQIIIESNPRGSQSSKYFANTHEYLLVFSKYPQPDITFGLSKDDDDLSEYKYEDAKGKYRLLGLRQRGGAWRKEDRPLLHYPIYINPRTRRVSLTESEEFSIKVIPQRPSGELGRWTWSTQKLNKQISEVVGIIVNEGTENEKWDIARKNYLTTEDGEVKLSKVKSLWIEKEINYQNGGTELKEILGDGKFDYPKPLFLLLKIIACSTKRHSTILDFFAGSGTTLHAVMQLNAEDGGHRQCILVTNNENGICEDVTYERNKRVIEGYTKPKGDLVEGLHANNLRYYSTGFVPRTQSPHDLRRLVDLSTDMLCIKENLYSPAEIDCNGKKIAKKYARRFKKDDREMIIIYEPKVIPFIVEHIKAREVKHEIKVYVNAPGRYAFDDDFSEVIDKITLCAIPDAILQAYRDVLPKAKDQELPPVNIDEDEIKKALEADSDYSYTDEKGGNL